jgi:hypothetical protein
MGYEQQGGPMGPENPLNIIDVRETFLPHGVRRIEVSYPDGVEVEFRTRLPASAESGRTIAANTPEDSFWVSTHMDEGEDGFTYAFYSAWVMCTHDCSTCPVSRAGMDKTCGLVVA